MPTITFEGKEIEFDDNGYMVDFSKWTREIASYMASDDGFKTLGEDPKQWMVLEMLRSLYQKNMLPFKDGEILFLITKASGLSLGKLHRIFKGLSIPKLLKWAGLPASYCRSGV